jgi:hypothetical protein
VGWLKRSRAKDDTKDGDPLAWVGNDDESDPAAEAARDTPDDRGTGSDDGSDRQGPWDVSEVETSEGYVDLGGLWLPGRDGMELRLEVEEETSRVIAASLGKMPTTSVRRLISPLSRSSGLVLCNFTRCATGKLMYASTSGSA